MPRRSSASNWQVGGPGDRRGFIRWSVFDEAEMMDQPSDPTPVPDRGMPILVMLFLIIAVYACSIYANLSFAVTSSADYRYFPPFKRGVNKNDNRHLGAEYFS